MIAYFIFWPSKLPFQLVIYCIPFSDNGIQNSDSVTFTGFCLAASQVEKENMCKHPSTISLYQLHAMFKNVKKGYKKKKKKKKKLHRNVKNRKFIIEFALLHNVS